MKLAIPAEAVAVLAVGAVAALWIVRKGSVQAAASSAAGAAVAAAGGAVSGTVGAIGASVGLPTPDATTTDPAVARWIIDNYGYLDASAWSGVPALFRASLMAPGTGTPPPRGSAIAAAFPVPVRAVQLPAVDDYSSGIGNVPFTVNVAPAYNAAPYGGVQAESWGLPL